MKQFDAGLFCGEVVSVTKNRGRFLYHVVYEDGDEEDMNDQEYREAYELNKIQTNKALKVSLTSMANEDSENDDDKSGGETEGSEYNGSEDGATSPQKKRKRTKRDQYIKEKAKKVEKKNTKEEDAINGKKPVIIDVDALLKTTSKTSVTAKTMDAMTANEKNAMLGSAEKKLMKEAKKGFRQEAMKVHCVVVSN
jgi:hypothetical protein